MRTATTIHARLAVLCGLLLAGAVACDKDSNTPVRPSPGQNNVQQSLTLDDVYAAPITSIVDQRIVVETRIAWTNALPICIFDPNCPRDTYLASPLTSTLR